MGSEAEGSELSGAERVLMAWKILRGWCGENPISCRIPGTFASGCSKDFLNFQAPRPTGGALRFYWFYWGLCLPTAFGQLGETLLEPPNDSP